MNSRITWKPRRHPASPIALALGALTIPALYTPAHAAIYRWNDNRLISGTENITPGPGVDLSGWNTDPHTLEYAILESLDLHGADFSASDLIAASFSHSNLINSNFTNTIVRYADFSGTNLSLLQLSSTASFQQHDLSGIRLFSFNMAGWNLAGQNLSNTQFPSADLSNANLSACDLSGSFSFGANLANASLSASNLDAANFGGSSLINADLSNAILHNTQFIAANLTNANFSNATLGASTSFFNATGFTFQQLASTASYRKKDLSGIVFGTLDLSTTDLSGQTLSSAWFSHANLADANLTNANVTNALFYKATLTNTHFLNAILDFADFRDAINFSPAGAASTNGMILTDGTIPSMHLTAGQKFSVRYVTDYPLRITDIAPSVEHDATFSITGSLFCPSLINDGIVTAYFADLHLGHIFGNGQLRFESSNITSGALRQQSLSLQESTLQIEPDCPTSSLSNLTLTGFSEAWFSTLDINGSLLNVYPDPLDKAFRLVILQSQVLYGRTHPAGITSSTLPPHTTLAVLDNAVTGFTTFGGLPVDPNSLLIAPELLGDANADGKIDLSDLSIVLNHFGQITPNWTSGNFDGSIAIDLADLCTVLNNFGLTNPSPSPQLLMTNDQSPATPTPEPVSLAFLGPALVAALARRSRV